MGKVSERGRRRVGIGEEEKGKEEKAKRGRECK